MKTATRTALLLCAALMSAPLPVARAQAPDVQGMVLQGLYKEKNDDIAGALLELERAWLANHDFTQQRYKVAQFYHKTGTRLMLTKHISASLVFFNRALRLINDDGSFIQSRTLAERLKPMEKKAAAGASKKSMSLSGPRTDGLSTDATSSAPMKINSRDAGDTGSDITLEIAITFTGLAAECQTAGDTANAIGYYRDALTVRPDMDMARMALEELGATAAE